MKGFDKAVELVIQTPFRLNTLTEDLPVLREVASLISGRFPQFIFIHRIHKWRTRGKKLVPSHESEALEGKQKLQTKTFSELAECLARIPPNIWTSF